MNVVKIQQDLIKDVLSGKAEKWFIQLKASEVYVMTKEQIYIFNTNDWLLNGNDLIGKGVKTTTIADNILKMSDDAKPAVRTGRLRETRNKHTLLELMSEDSKELVYVDQTLLKYYDKSAEFSVTDPKKQVFVYEADILVGIVLPVNVNA